MVSDWFWTLEIKPPVLIEGEEKIKEDESKEATNFIFFYFHLLRVNFLIGINRFFQCRLWLR